MSPVQKIPVLILALALLLPLAGCESEEDKAYRTAYNANREAGYLTGLQEGRARGEIEGAAAGADEALKAAETGSAWQLYLSLALAAAVSGLMLGLLIQYSILVVCRQTEELPQFLAVAFVPAMTSTLVYDIFKRRRDAMLAIDEQLRQMVAHMKLRVTRIEELKAAVALKLKEFSNIEELSHARLLELAAEELERIVSDSTNRAGATTD